MRYLKLQLGQGILPSRILFKGIVEGTVPCIPTSILSVRSCRRYIFSLIPRMNKHYRHMVVFTLMATANCVVIECVFFWWIIFNLKSYTKPTPYKTKSELLWLSRRVQKFHPWPGFTCCTCCSEAKDFVG